MSTTADYMQLLKGAAKVRARVDAAIESEIRGCEWGCDDYIRAALTEPTGDAS